jgi:transposase-like protein
MTKQTRRRFSPDYKEEAVGRLSEPGATHGSVAGELGITPTQLKTWRLELEAAGSGASIATQKAEAAELTQLRRDNKRLKEKVEVLRKASAFFAQRMSYWGRPRHEDDVRLHRRSRCRARHSVQERSKTLWRATDRRYPRGPSCATAAFASRSAGSPG